MSAKTPLSIFSAALATLALAMAAPALAAFGNRDCSFGNAGVHTPSGSFGWLLGAVTEADGNILVRLGFLSTGTSIYRIGTDGTTSAQVGSVSNMNLVEATIVVQADGGILVSTGCGLCPNPPPGATPPGIARFLPAGGLDTTFGANGYATLSGFSAALSAPILQPDGRILVGGTFNGAAALVRFNANGTPDATFGSGGVAVDPVAIRYSHVALQADGTILAAAEFSRLTRHTASGQLDTTFGSSGSINTVVNTIHQILIQPSGKILIVGFSPNTGEIRIARYNTNGNLDFIGGSPVFRDARVNGAPMFRANFPDNAHALMADGRVVIAGTSSSTGYIVRYGVDLTDDAVIPLAFEPNAVHVLPTGRLLVGRVQSTELRRLLGDSDPATCVTTSTTMSSAPNPSNFGQAVTLTATVTPASVPPAQGSVQFKQGTSNVGSAVTLSNGVATTQTSSLPEGTSTLTAVFTGTGVYLGSTSAGTAHTVNPRPATTTTVSSSPNPSSCGATVTFTATVAPASGSGTPTGTVQFKNGASNMGAPRPLTGAGATLTESSLLSGSNSITAVYSGDSTYGPSTSPTHSHVVPNCLMIQDATGNAAQSPATARFAVTLTRSGSTTVTVGYATADHTAMAGVHYTATSGTLTFSPGTDTQFVDVPITTQSAPGPSKDFFVVLSNPTNAELRRGAGIGTIIYSAPGTLSVHIDDPSVTEGPPGVTLLGFTVSLSKFVSSSVNVTYTTADGSALAGTDYTAQSGTLTFAPNQVQRWVLVPIIGNANVQSNRTFFVNLSNATNGATIVKSQGTGTIVDDDPAQAAASTSMYRLYSDFTKEHLYTPDANEYAVLATRGWTQEGIAFKTLTNGTYGGQDAIPLYRMYNGHIVQHHWTTDANEVMTLAGFGTWSFEGRAGYVLPSAAAGTTPLYRLMYANPPLHLWTIDANEKNVLSTQYGWTYEGVTGEVLP